MDTLTRYLIEGTNANLAAASEARKIVQPKPRKRRGWLTK